MIKFTLALLVVILSASSFKSAPLDDYDYFSKYLDNAKISAKFNVLRKVVVDQKPVNSFSNLKLIVINIDGLNGDYLESSRLPNIDKYFVKKGARSNLNLKSQDESLNSIADEGRNQTGEMKKCCMPVWLLNESSKKGKSVILGSLPGAKERQGNKTVSYLNDLKDRLNWYEKVDRLIELVSSEKNKKINLAVLHYPELNAAKQKYGCDSEAVHKLVIDFDTLISYLMARLTDLDILNRVNIIVTSNFGLKQTNETNQQRTVKFNESILKTNSKQNKNVDEKQNESEIKNDSHETKDSTQNLKKIDFNKIEKGVKIYSIENKLITEENNNKCSDMGVFLARGPSVRQTKSKNMTIDLIDVKIIVCRILGLSCNLTVQVAQQNSSSLSNSNKSLKQSEENGSIISTGSQTSNANIQANATEQVLLTTTSSTNTSSHRLIQDLESYINSNLTIEFRKFYKFIDQHYSNVKFMNFLHLFVLFIILCAFVIIIFAKTNKLHPASADNFKYRPFTN